MSLYDRATEFATRELAGITTDDGEPYIDHALRVANKMDTEEEKIVAILHDVVEDTEVSLSDLEMLGLSREVIDAVGQLTKRTDMTYMEYIDDISTNDLATKVKIAEVEDNKDIFRVNKMSFKTYTLEERAKKVLGILKNHDSI